ncbi:uncharacterized protein LOC121367676 isoform X2 [Gigantopelta aegis]|uniref:uncharacterized protein LOC121367676 isoform X2 n=1 Tax=Gigantopelta aegis TaxID=1735272 RepID=UPI001B88E673|nr:uncharacterized protein LOC121367676 isoform X2 [Gigantopelta aegis]
MFTLKTTYGVVIVFTALVYSLGTSKKPKNEKLKRHYEDLEEKYNRLAQIQNEQAAQLFQVTDGLRALCQSTQASPWDLEVTDEPRITATFDDHTSSPSSTVHDLRPLAFRFERTKQHFVYELDYEADSQPYIFWRYESQLVIEDDARNKVINNFASHSGSSKLVSQNKVVRVTIILGPRQYIVDINARQSEASEFELDLKPIGVDLGKRRRREFVPGEILEFTAEIPKSYSRTQQFVTLGGSFTVMDKSYPPTAKEFRVWEPDFRGPFSVQRFDSSDSYKAIFRLNTGEHEMEGLFSVEATIRLTNDLEPSVVLTESQSVIFYKAHRDVPYPKDFIAFVEHNNYLQQPCEEGTPCFITCKALGHFLGDVHITREGKPPESIPVQSHQLKLWGGLYEAVFTIDNFRQKNAGNYTCRARSKYKAAVTQSVSVPFYKQAMILNGSGILMHNALKLVFKCVATGYPRINISLYKNRNVSDIFENSLSADLTWKLQHNVKTLTLVVDKTHLKQRLYNIGCVAEHAYHSTTREFDVSPTLK